MTAASAMPRREQAALRFITGYQAAHDGISPSFEQLREALGLSSKSHVMPLLDRLEARLRIQRLRGRFRAIRVLAPIAIPRAPDGAPLYAVPLAAAVMA